MSHKDVTLKAISDLIQKYTDHNEMPCPLCEKVCSEEAIAKYAGESDDDYAGSCLICPNMIFYSSDMLSLPCSQRSTRYSLSFIVWLDDYRDYPNLVEFWTKVLAVYTAADESELFPPNERIKQAILDIAEPYKK